TGRGNLGPPPTSGSTNAVRRRRGSGASHEGSRCLLPQDRTRREHANRVLRARRIHLRSDRAVRTTRHRALERRLRCPKRRILRSQFFDLGAERVALRLGSPQSRDKCQRALRIERRNELAIALPLFGGSVARARWNGRHNRLRQRIPPRIVFRRVSRDGLLDAVVLPHARFAPDLVVREEPRARRRRLRCRLDCCQLLVDNRLAHAVFLLAAIAILAPTLATPAASLA